MDITDPAEIKLIEKYREITAKLRDAASRSPTSSSRIGRNWSDDGLTVSGRTLTVDLRVADWTLDAIENALEDKKSPLDPSVVTELE